MYNVELERELRLRYEILRELLNAQDIRLWAACEARRIGRGGCGVVSRATRLPEAAIRNVMREVARAVPSQLRVATRRPTKRKLLESKPQLLSQLDTLIRDHLTDRYNAVPPILLTDMSTRDLARELTSQGHRVSHMKVADFLVALGYVINAPRNPRDAIGRQTFWSLMDELQAAVRARHERNLPVLLVHVAYTGAANDERRVGILLGALSCVEQWLLTAHVGASTSDMLVILNVRGIEPNASTIAKLREFARCRIGNWSIHVVPCCTIRLTLVRSRAEFEIREGPATSDGRIRVTLCLMGRASGDGMAGERELRLSD